MKNTKQILLLHGEGRSGRWIAGRLGMSRGTVAKVLAAVEEHPLEPDMLEAMSESSVCRHLFPDDNISLGRVLPDLEYIHRELKKPGVTLRLLWEEYRNCCLARGEVPYQYSRFCDLYRMHVESSGLTAPLVHKPGGEAMVDWAGTPVWMTDPETGKRKKLYIFVGTLPYSMYTYAQACLSMDESHWIDAHVCMFEFFGGVSRMLTCDNTKTAVIHNRKSEDPLLNRAYKEFADHYSTVLMPTRVRSPMDKAAV